MGDFQVNVNECSRVADGEGRTQECHQVSGVSNWVVQEKTIPENSGLQKWNSDTTDTNDPVTGKRGHSRNQINCTKNTLMALDFKGKYKKIIIEHLTY